MKLSSQERKIKKKNEKFRIKSGNKIKKMHLEKG